MLPLFNLLIYSAWGLLRVPLFWAKVGVILWIHFLFPRSFMRYGLLVATALSLLGRAFCVLSAYKRACYRALRYGMAEYRGKMLLPTDVLWRFRESFRQLPSARKELTLVSIAFGIRCMTWNISKALVYDELLIWAFTRPFEVLVIQETGWRFSATWSISEWHCTHSACKQTSLRLGDGTYPPRSSRSIGHGYLDWRTPFACEDIS